ncbi:MAG: F0F1 ATP synthase subunit B [Candidatus Omnitrophica bacterium]|nr:F0F1 ATP synthase subunit B [Candidatus Omnitrophota bacterium]
MEFFKASIIPGEVLVQLIAFIIVFWTLKLLAWKPILGALEARRQRIKGDFDKIEAARKDIESLKAQYSASLQKIEDEARAKLQEAVEEGRKISRDIQEKARAEAQASFEKAKDNLALEAAKARITLRREIADLAIHVSERLLHEKLTETKQQEKIMEMIEELEKT